MTGSRSLWMHLFQILLLYANPAAGLFLVLYLCTLGDEKDIDRCAPTGNYSELEFAHHRMLYNSGATPQILTTTAQRIAAVHRFALSRLVTAVRYTNASLRNLVDVANYFRLQKPTNTQTLYPSVKNGHFSS